MGDMDFDYNALNMNLRLRDLETKLVDLKGDMERRMIQVIEEHPIKLMQQIKYIEEKETGLWAENLERHNKVGDTVSTLQAKSNNQVEKLRAQMMEMQKKLEEVSYKNIELERNLNTVARVNKDAMEANFNSIENKQAVGRDFFDINNEIKLIKDRLIAQEDNKLRFYKDVTGQIEQLNNQVLKNENEFYTRLREQKKQLSEETGGKGSNRKLEEYFLINKAPNGEDDGRQRIPEVSS